MCVYAYVYVYVCTYVCMHFSPSIFHVCIAGVEEGRKRKRYLFVMIWDDATHKVWLCLSQGAHEVAELLLQLKGRGRREVRRKRERIK